MTTILIVLALPFFGETSPRRADSSSPSFREPRAEQRRDLACEVRTILSVKCAECHGVNLPRSIAKFGYVEDLKRVAANPKLVVPFQPDESKLWQLVRDNNAARTGPGGVLDSRTEKLDPRLDQIRRRDPHSCGNAS